MKKILFALILSASFIACKSDKKTEKTEDVSTKVSEIKIEDGSYQAKVDASTLNWKGNKPTGSHNGTVAIKEGNLNVLDGKLTGGKFIFDMESITVLDLPADDEYNGKLVAHLKNEDFFDVVNHPTAVFEITSVSNNIVKGNLTVKDITKPIEFTSKLSVLADGIELSSDTFKIDRTDFNIQYKSKKFFDNLKDKFIDDEFEISFKVLASK